ncbi:MAG: FAD-linked oxidase C-terminal domain-containing protein [Methylococcaceae bacterium]
MALDDTPPRKHGIVLKKRDFVDRELLNAHSLELMRNIKPPFDPKDILKF